MVFCVSAQKGGVGKTSLTVHLSGVMAENGRVLLVDIDPQHSLSNTFVKDVYELSYTVKDLLLDPDTPVDEVIQKTKFEKIDIIPSNLGLGINEIDLIKYENHFLLSDKLEQVKMSYEYVLIDCPPNLGIFTKLALVASDAVLIPLECSSYAIKSTMFLLELIQSIQNSDNPELEISGFIINRFDSRRRLENDYRDLIREKFGPKVFQAEIKNNVKYAEAVTLRIPISFYKPKSEQTQLMSQLVKEIIGG